MSNKETMKKTKLFFSLEKELNYINEMNKAGWKLSLDISRAAVCIILKKRHPTSTLLSFTPPQKKR